MKNIFDLIPDFRKIKNKCLESTPSTLTDAHIQLFREYNFSFLSVGIQSLDKMICKKQNRPYLSRNEFSKKKKTGRTGNAGDIFCTFSILVCSLNPLT
jgi:coproporphyrinogen III oxidase-like Fe-S oxidoreductase